MIERAKKNKGGAPKGNQNARKHGYYSKVLTNEQLQAIPSAASLAGLDREIAVARIKLQAIIANDPRNYSLLFRALSVTSKLLNTRELIGGASTPHQPPANANTSSPSGIPEQPPHSSLPPASEVV